MKYEISITDMTKAELVMVTKFLESMGATDDRDRMSRTVAELAKATGASPAAPGAPVPPPAPASVVIDPFAAPPQAPAAPVPPPAPQAPVGTAPAVDSRGIPHNPQFHADSKRQNKDGTWARRKGCDKAAADAWEAAIIDQAQSVPPAPTAAQLNAQFAPHLPPQGATDPFAAPPVAPSAPVPPQAPAVTYAQWHSMYSNLVTSGRLSPDKYVEIATRYGAVEDPMRFSDDAGARAACYAEFEALAA